MAGCVVTRFLAPGHDVLLLERDRLAGDTTGERRLVRTSIRDPGPVDRPGHPGERGGGDSATRHYIHER
jgi:hypothetical protein